MSYIVSGDDTRDADHVYRHPDGAVAYTVERRYGVPRPEKFRIVGPDGTTWPDPIPEPDRVLYRLPELRASRPGDTVYIAEGERDADLLASWGLTVTTMPCGTRGGWLSRYSEEMTDRHVVVICDADRPGRRHAEDVASDCQDHALTALVLDLHDGRLGRRDVTDWAHRATNDLDRFERLVAGARYAWAGLPDGRKLIKRDHEQLLLRADLSAAEKLLIFAVMIRRQWSGDPAPLPPVALLAADIGGVHRVTAAKVLAGLRARGVLSGDRLSTRIAWDIVAMLVPVERMHEV